ncbi:MAG: amidohydrolase family protein [Actinomycetota bacterium]
MIVDAHLHVFLSQREDPARTADALAPADRRAPVEQLLATMDMHGVDRAVVVPLGPEDAYVTRVLREHHERFRGICVDDPTTTPETVLDRVVDGGFEGVRMFGLPEAERDRWERLVAILAERDLVLWMYPRAEDLPRLRQVASAHPELRIALNHSGLVQSGIGVDEQGRPRIDSPVPQPTRGEVAALAEYPNLVVLLSGAYGFSTEPYPYADVAAHVAPIARAFGPARLLWASDFPWPIEDPGYDRLLDLVDHHLPDLSPAARTDVLGESCRRFLRWES